MAIADISEFSVHLVADTSGALSLPVAAKRAGIFIVHLSLSRPGWSVTHPAIGATLAYSLTSIEEAETLTAKLRNPRWEELQSRAEAIEHRRELNEDMRLAVKSLGLAGEFTSGGNFCGAMGLLDLDEEC